jgi:hypothetical protein
MACPAHPAASPQKLMFLEKNRPDDNEDQPTQEYKNSDPVDPVHVLHPLGVRRIRVPLFNVEIFPYLSPYSHKIGIFSVN